MHNLIARAQCPQQRVRGSVALPPCLTVIRKIAQGLHVTRDQLIFDDAERRPDEELKMMFEAVDAFDDDDKQMVKKVIQGVIIQNQIKRWSAGAQQQCFRLYNACGSLSSRP